MLRKAFAVGALVAATTLASPAFAQEQPSPAQASSTSTVCTSTSVYGKPCEWREGKHKRCKWCQNKKGVYKKQYCEQKSAPGKAPESPKKEEKKEGILCKGDLDEDAKPCQRCVNQRTGKIFGSTCKGEKSGDPAP
ncbi:hypothetical protein ACNF49_18580 [Actinomadura sp. ATCC 39365]